METTRTTPTPAEATTRDEAEEVEAETGAAREMPCPVCGHPMPDLKGGKDSICPVCGFKDSCCY
jgi:rubrerythrin